MEVRKLMAFGNSSYVVSLPKAWVNKNKLKKGAALVVEERPSEIIFSAQEGAGDQALREVTVNCTGKNEPEIKTEITAMYVINANVITITHIDKTKASFVKGIIHGLVGMEVIEETSTRIIAKDFLDLKAFTIPGTFRRADIIVRSMLEDSLQGNKEDVDSIDERDNEINRLMLLSARTGRAAMENPLLLRHFDMTYWEVLIAKQIMQQVEMFGDQVKRISRAIPEIKDEKQKEEVMKIYRKIRSDYLDVMKIYYAKSAVDAIKKETATRKLFKECSALMEKNPNVTTARLVEYLNYMIVALTRILRSTMEMKA